jgi:hypothetical protein
MYRGSTKTYNQYTGSVRGYNQPSILGSQYVESEECRLIQEKKNELITSLANYFASKVKKSDLESSLSTIKLELSSKCPSYTSRVGCC